jgi:hypothetical protein
MFKVIDIIRHNLILHFIMVEVLVVFIELGLDGSADCPV